MLLRSMFFVPGHKTQFLEKCLSFPVDAVILDTEDSVPLDSKHIARKNILDFLNAREEFPFEIFIRLNEINSGFLLDDLDALTHKRVTGFMLSKVFNELDISFYSMLLKQYEYRHNFPQKKFKLCPLIECCSAILNLDKIAKNCTERLVGIAFGGEDYLTDLNGSHGLNDSTFHYPLAKIGLVANSVKTRAIDTPYLQVYDLAGFQTRLQMSRSLGFSGCLLVHPNQIEVANRIFSPTETEINEAKEIVSAVKHAKEKNLSVSLVDGKLVGPPMLKHAEKILQESQLIEQKV
jgi:citrate lyase subunit beta / citryl-CoA lyase